jgi:hypothetical protein
MDIEHEDEASSLFFEKILREIPGSYYMQHLDSEQTGGKPRTVVFFVRIGMEADSALSRVINQRD